MSENIVITGAARTPMGGFQGILSDATAPQLGAAAIKAAIERSQLQGEAIDEVKHELSQKALQQIGNN